MRRLLLAFPILTLSACSYFESPQVNPYGVHAQNAHYQHGYTYKNNAQNCVWTPCPPSSYALRPPSYLDQTVCCSNAHQYQKAHPHQLRGMHRPSAYNTAGNAGFGPGPQDVYRRAPQLRRKQNQRREGYYSTLGSVLYDDDSEFFGLEGRVGYDTGRVFGLELEGSVGIVDEEKIVNEPSIGDVDLNINSNYNLAVFAVGRLPVSSQLSVHGRTGYDFRQLRVDGTAEDGTSATVNGRLDGFAFGAGAEYALSEHSGLRFDVTRYNNTLGSIESVSASFSHKF